MNKIPVAATIGAAYRFAFARFFGNLGVIWVPLALIMAAAWYSVPSMLESWSKVMASLPQTGDAAPPDVSVLFPQMIQAYRMILVLWVAAILLRAQMMLGLTERALGTYHGPSFVFLSLGKAFWRLAGAYFAVVLILGVAEMVLFFGFALAGVIVGVVAAIMGAGHDASAITIGGSVSIGIFAVLGALFYIAVRLTFLLTPVMVAEDKFDLIRPWKLAGGNFWRIFAIGVAIFVPLGIAVFTVYVPLEIGVLSDILKLPAAQAHDPQAGAKILTQVSGALMEMVRKNWYILVPLAFVSTTLFYGIAAGASAAGYRALVPERESGPAAA